MLKSGLTASLPIGAKAQALMSRLALQHGQRVYRDALLDVLWPGSDRLQAGQSLNSLIYSINKHFVDDLRRAPAVLHADGYYRLNVEAGVGVDIAQFDCLANCGDQELRAGQLDAAMPLYAGAANLYRGDLCVDHDVHAVLERERLRARYLNLLASLADFHYQREDFDVCLSYASRMLASDPCREDAHRSIMRSYARLGQRTQALRQYRLCETLLRSEFDAAPDSVTRKLFDQIRLDPGSV